METLKLTVWGVRGSFPVAAESFLGYGGNTSCFSLQMGENLVVLDAGSGLASLGEELGRRGDIKNIHILLSHAHLDHVMGLCPFLSAPLQGRGVHIYGGAALEGLGTLAGPPYWPCTLGDMGVKLHRVTPGEPFRLAGGAVSVSTMEGTHPGGCLWYRVELGGKTLVYMLDCEVEPSRETEMLRFARNAGILIWDAAWPPGREMPGWGHSTWAQGAELGQKAGADRVLMAHYARNLDDRAVGELESTAARTWAVYLQEKGWRSSCDTT